MASRLVVDNNLGLDGLRTAADSIIGLGTDTYRSGNVGYHTKPTSQSQFPTVHKGSTAEQTGACPCPGRWRRSSPGRDSNYGPICPSRGRARTGLSARVCTRPLWRRGRSRRVRPGRVDRGSNRAGPGCSVGSVDYCGPAGPPGRDHFEQCRVAVVTASLDCHQHQCDRPVDGAG